MGERVSVVFDDFAGGDWGSLLGPDQAPAGTYRGHNVVVYETGVLGPRPGMIEMGTLPAGFPGGLAISNPVGGIGVEKPVGLAIAGSGVHRWDLMTGVAGGAISGSFAASAAGYPAGVWADVGTAHVYVARPGDGVYRVDLDAGTLTKLASSPMSRVVARVGPLIAAGGDEGQTPNEVYYSTAGDPTEWNPLNFELVGDLSPVTFLRQMRSTLVAGKKSGWMGIGGLGTADPYLQVLSDAPGPATGAAVAVTGTGAVGYMPGDGPPVAAVFDGGVASVQRDRRFPYVAGENPPVVEERALPAPSASVVRAGRNGLLYSATILAPSTFGPTERTAVWLFDGLRWSFHGLSRGLGHLAAPELHQVYGLDEPFYPHNYVWATGWDIDPSPLYRLRVGDLQRPGYGMGSQADAVLGASDDPGATSGHHVEFPTVRDPERRMIRPQNVTLHLERYSMGPGYGTRYVEVVLLPVGDDQQTDADPGVVVWSFTHRDDGVGTEEGSVRVVRSIDAGPFGTWPASGYRVRLALHGFGLRAVEVEHEVLAGRRP